MSIGLILQNLIMNISPFLPSAQINTIRLFVSAVVNCLQYIQIDVGILLLLHQAWKLCNIPAAQNSGSQIISSQIIHQSTSHSIVVENGGYCVENGGYCGFSHDWYTCLMRCWCSLASVHVGLSCRRYLSGPMKQEVFYQIGFSCLMFSNVQVNDIDLQMHFEKLCMSEAVVNVH